MISMRIVKYLLLGFFIAMLCAGTYFAVTFHNPPHYRTSSNFPSPLRYIHGYIHGYSTFNPNGLNKLNAIASGYLDLNQLDKLIHSTPGPVVVLNGINDDIHYLKDKNLKFYCLEYSNEQIVPINRGPLKNVVCRARQLAAGIFNPWDNDKKYISTEAKFLADKGVEYRTPLPDNWLADWDFMDDMVDFFDKVDKKSTLYFHCGHGQGRTTTMLTLWDMYNNSHDVSTHDILSRQYLLGGEDLLDLEEWKNGTWSSNHLKSRRDLVLAFHKYMNAPDGYHKTKWSEWIAKHDLGPQKANMMASQQSL